MSIVATLIACLHYVYKIIQLLQEKHIANARVPRADHDALQIAIANGDQSRAKVFVEKGYAVRLVLEGEDSKELKRMKVFIERSSTPGLYGTTHKWK
jgi:hypothetical protein